MKESDIISLLFNRDEFALEIIDKEYKGYYYSIISSIIDSPEDCEECVNDVLLGLWNSIPPNNPDNLKGYICRIARNVAINCFRKKTTQKRMPDKCMLSLNELQEAIPDTASVDDELLRNELSKTINEFLFSCSERDRYIFVCRYYYFMDIKDLSRAFALSESHVRTVLSRIRKALRNYLGEWGML